MTRREAGEILQSIWKGPSELQRSRHFLEQCGQEAFTTQDVYVVLRSHRLDGVPEPRSSGAHRVRLLGKCLEGRPTLLVLDLWKGGPCVLVSIMVDKRPQRNRRGR